MAVVHTGWDKNQEYVQGVMREPSLSFLCVLALMCIVKPDGPPMLCKTDEIGEIVLNSRAGGTMYYGLPGVTKNTFEVRMLNRINVRSWRCFKVYIMSLICQFVEFFFSCFLGYSCKLRWNSYWRDTFHPYRTLGLCGSGKTQLTLSWYQIVLLSYFVLVLMIVCVCVFYQGSLVFVVGRIEGLLMVSGRRHNADDLVATALAVEPVKTVYRGRWALQLFSPHLWNAKHAYERSESSVCVCDHVWYRIAVFSVTVFYDERIVIVAEQRPDANEEDSFQWMSRVLQVSFLFSRLTKRWYKTCI